MQRESEETTPEAQNTSSISVRSKSSVYDGVYFKKASKKWEAYIRIKNEGKKEERIQVGTFTHEREAARAVDIARIKNGLEPVNILKPVK